MVGVEQTLTSQKLYLCHTELFCREHDSCFTRETSALYFTMFSGFCYFPNSIKSKCFKALLIHFFCLHRHFIYFNLSNLKSKARAAVPWTGELCFSSGSLQLHVTVTLRDPNYRSRNFRTLIILSFQFPVRSLFPLVNNVIYKYGLYLEL